MPLAGLIAGELGRPAETLLAGGSKLTRIQARQPPASGAFAEQYSYFALVSVGSQRLEF
jgi:hypothetical protein